MSGNEDNKRRDFLKKVLQLVSAQWLVPVLQAVLKMINQPEKK